VDEAVRRAPEQLLCEQPGQERDAELNGPGRLELECFDKRSANTRVVAADVEHAEAAEHVEKAVAVRVVQVLPLGARPDAVEPDRLQHAHELRVDRPRVDVVVLARALPQELPDHVRSVPPSKRREPRLSGALETRQDRYGYLLWPFPWLPPWLEWPELPCETWPEFPCELEWPELPCVVGVVGALLVLVGVTVVLL